MTLTKPVGLGTLTQGVELTYAGRIQALPAKGAHGHKGYKNPDIKWTVCIHEFSK